MSALVSQAEGLVIWTDFRTLTGVYHHALLPEELGPDPALNEDDEWSRRLPPPDPAFDAHQYHNVVDAAMADRSWEPRARAVIQLMRPQRPEWTLWAARHGDTITVHHRVAGMAWSTDLDLPPGPVDRLSDSLVEVLERHDPREIAARRLWR